jgi:hypothetical protein
VTLVAGRDDVQLAGTVTDLTPDESAALLATLNAHFAGDGIAFVAPRPDAWFVRTDTAPDLTSTSLDIAQGRTLRALLPTGHDAGTWRRWQNEIQMLLHEHPVNAARENRGAAVANSVWFAAGGTLPARGDASIRTYANGGIATALAHHAHAPAKAMPDNLRAAMAGVERAAMLVVAFATLPDLATLDRNWLDPAWTALSRGGVDTVTIIGSGDDGAAIWNAKRPSAWDRLTARFRTPAAMPHLAAARAQLAADV